MNKNEKNRLLINIIIPIVVGAVIYYLYSPEVLFVKSINSIIGGDYHEAILGKSNIILEFIRNYFLDMLWAYALVMALFWGMYDNTVNLFKLLCIAVSFSMAMETLQIMPIINGTFDFWDVIVEVLAEIIAVFIIKFFLKKEKRE